MYAVTYIRIPNVGEKKTHADSRYEDDIYGLSKKEEKKQ